MDKLTNDEKILAWNSTWHPSFDGVAIVNEDFSFRSINPQFCELLGVTPADLIGKRFQDITPPKLKELDERNAKMVIDGSIDFYLLPKRYEFSRGQEVDVVLLVTAARDPETRDFLFFVSRIMLDENGELLSAHSDEISKSGQSSQKLVTMVLDFVTRYWMPIAVATAVIAGLINEFFNMGIF